MQRNMEQLIAKDQELETLRKQAGNSAEVAELTRKVQAAEMEKQMNKTVFEQLQKEMDNYQK